MASAAAALTQVEDLPDHVLERVFVLAGTRFGPAIVGVCRRWARVYWGSPQLWSHLAISQFELEQPPIARWPGAPLLLFDEHQREHQHRRKAGWQAAKRAQLQRVGHLAESAQFGRVPQALLSALLQLLRPAALRRLELPPPLEEEQAFIMAGLTQLTRLACDADNLGPVVPRLAKLQHLTLVGGHVSTQLMAALQSLAALTCLELKPARIYTQELQSLSRLRQLLHLSMRGSSAMHRLPPLASCPSLESYSVDDACQASAERLGVAQTVLAARDDWLEERLAGLSAWVTTAPMVEPPAPSPTCIQMAGFALMALSFTPVPAADCEHAGWGGPKADGGGRPGSLRIQGILPRAPPRADDAGGSDGDGAGQPPAEPAPQLNDLLEAALPPGAVLQQLTLSQCDLDASALQRLPAIASLQHLQLLACSSRASGGMDAPMQALAQLAPALTALRFEATRSGLLRGQAGMLHACPVYLLAHPSLRCLTVLNRQHVEWDLEEALHRLPSLAAAVPVLEHLTTDALPFMPPALAAVSSLRGLAFLDQPQFELTGEVVELCLALPHLTSLTLPQLTGFEAQAAEQLRAARPGFTLQVQPSPPAERKQQQRDEQMGEEEEEGAPGGGAMHEMCVIC